MNSGYIKLHRSLLDWEWYVDINVTRLFVHLVLKVNHSEKKWQGKLVKEGQLITSISKLSLETGLTTKQVRLALNKLKRTNEVALKSTSQYTMIYVQNYKKYQGVKHQEGIREGKPGANEGQTKGKRRATTKECKEGKNEKNEKNNTKKIYKKKFLDYVFLADDEYRKLVDEYGEEFTQKCIKRLDLHIPNKTGSPYKDHYRAILSWVVGAVEKDEATSKTEKMSFRNGKLVECQEGMKSTYDKALDIIKKRELG